MFSYAKHYFLATFVEKTKLTKIMGSLRTPMYFWSSLLSANPQLQIANLHAMKKWYFYRLERLLFSLEVLRTLLLGLLYPKLNFEKNAIM